jgi:hypothetical protein
MKDRAILLVVSLSLAMGVVLALSAERSGNRGQVESATGAMFTATATGTLEVTGLWTIWDDYDKRAREMTYTFTMYDLEIPCNAMTVTVSTNVVPIENKRCHICANGSGDTVIWDQKQGRLWPHMGMCELTLPGSERTETTIITERRVLRLKWQGEWRELASEKELARTTKRWVKKEQWEVQP